MDSLILAAALGAAVWFGWWASGFSRYLDRGQRDEMIAIEADRSEDL